MFKEEKFRAALAENKLTVADVAQALNISKTTLYRKMSGDSDFYRSEMRKIKKMLNRDNVDDIFFAD